MSPSPYPWAVTEYLQDWPTWVDSSYVDAILPQCYRYDIASYNATVAQQKSYYRNTSIPFYPGVLLKSGTNLASDTYLTDMIKYNRTSGFKGECFFFYEGICAYETFNNSILYFSTIGSTLSICPFASQLLQYVLYLCPSSSQS